MMTARLDYSSQRQRRCVGSAILFALLVAIAAIAVQVPSARAQTVPYNAALISWENATSYTDGIPLNPAADLLETRIERSICNADGTAGATLQTLTVPVPGGPLSVLFETLPDNTLQCFRARHVSTAGVLSAFSVTVSKAITSPPKKPRPPRNPRAE